MQKIPAVFTTQAAPARSPNFYTVETQNQFPLDYKGMNYVYFFCAFPFQLTVGSYGTLVIPANTWYPILFPETTKLQMTASSIVVQCTDVPIQATVFPTPRITFDVWTLNKQALSSFSTGPISSANYSELAIDFTVYSFTGGSSPTVTFLVSRVGLDGQLYKLEEATALSAAGVISYSIGAGLDGKSFGGQFQVDMVLTGNPTSITVSGSIKAKQ